MESCIEKVEVNMTRVILQKKEIEAIKYVHSRMQANNEILGKTITELRNDNAALIVMLREKYFNIKNKYEIKESIELYHIDYYTRSLTIKQNSGDSNG